VDRELHPRHRLAAMHRQQRGEAEALAPAVEAPHQVDRLALVVGVARVQLVERVSGDERVFALLERPLDLGDVAFVGVEREPVRDAHVVDVIALMQADFHASVV
jgi:hypothetical protein